MAETNYKGIDYGLGQSNVDKSNGIRYGVINQNEVLQAWCDASEPYYGKPTCPKCGNEAIESDKAPEKDEDGKPIDRDEYEEGHGCNDYVCDSCKYIFDSDEAFGDEPISHYIDDEEYKAECGESGDIFITKSPYYTRAQFCSPCAPGAGYLMNPCDSGEKAYCFGHDWFEDKTAPYPVYRVDDDSLVYPDVDYYTRNGDEQVVGWDMDESGLHPWVRTRRMGFVVYNGETK